MLKPDHYLHSIVLLSSGSVIGQIIGFVGSLFMTRLYSASEIGIMTSIVSVTAIFASVINGRFDYAVVKEQNRENIFALIKLSVIIGIVFSFLVSVCSFPYFAGIDGFISPLLASVFVFLILLVQSFTNVFTSYNNNRGDYSTIKAVVILRRTAEEVSMVILGLVDAKEIGLLISRVIGQYFGMKRQIGDIRRYFGEILSVSKASMSEVFSIHRRQLFYSAPASLVNSGSYAIVSLVIGHFFGMDTLGVYAISFAVLGLPLSIISGNVAKVYFREASVEFVQNGSFYPSTVKTLKYMILFALLLFLVMYYAFPILVPVIYGQKYVESGSMIRILAPMFSIRFISLALNTGLVICNKQKFELFIQLFFLISAVMFAVLGKYMHLTVIQFLIGISVSFSIVYSVNLFAVCLFSKRVIA